MYCKDLFIYFKSMFHVKKITQLTFNVTITTISGW